MSTSPNRVAPHIAVGERAQRVLVVEDDEAVSTLLHENLTEDRFDVTVCASAEDALAVIDEVQPDVAIVDFGLPGMSGIELIDILREGRPESTWDTAMAIVVLSGRADSLSIVRGIDRGADDYLVKPFDYPELLARLASHLRRAQGITLAGTVRVGPLEIDRRALCANANGLPVKLSSKEFSLLCALARNPTKVVPKVELLREVWGFTSSGRTRTVDSHASRLRRKLNDAGLHGWVRNLWGFGYRLLPEEH